MPRVDIMPRDRTVGTRIRAPVVPTSEDLHAAECCSLNIYLNLA